MPIAGFYFWRGFRDRPDQPGPWKPSSGQQNMSFSPCLASLSMVAGRSFASNLHPSIDIYRAYLQGVKKESCSGWIAGPSRFWQIQETCSSHPAAISCRNSTVVTSYDQKNFCIKSHDCHGEGASPPPHQPVCPYLEWRGFALCPPDPPFYPGS